MSFIRIDRIFTMDPGSPTTPKNIFFPDDPFGIVIFASASADIVAERYRYDIVWQMVNPRDDPYETAWYSKLSGGYERYHTIDWHQRNNLLQWQYFRHPAAFPTYRYAVDHILGPSKHSGVFSVRGSIEVIGTDLFDMTAPFAFNYRVRSS